MKPFFEEVYVLPENIIC